MVEEIKQELVTDQRLTTEQVYLQEVLEKFNTNPDDPSLQDVERVLLGKIKVAQKSIAEATKQVEDINAEIRERQERGNVVVQQLVHLRGQSQGLVDSLLALR